MHPDYDWFGECLPVINGVQMLQISQENKLIMAYYGMTQRPHKWTLITGDWEVSAIPEIDVNLIIGIKLKQILLIICYSVQNYYD